MAENPETHEAVEQYHQARQEIHQANKHVKWIVGIPAALVAVAFIAALVWGGIQWQRETNALNAGQRANAARQAAYHADTVGELTAVKAELKSNTCTNTQLQAIIEYLSRAQDRRAGEPQATYVFPPPC